MSGLNGVKSDESIEGFLKKWRIILGVVIFLLILLVVIVRRERATQPSNAALRFEGFTPLTNGAAALFIFTNATRHSVHFKVASIEYRTPNGWATLPQTTANTLVGALRRGTGFPWEVQVPDTNTAWRIGLSCVEHATDRKSTRLNSVTVKSRMPSSA